MTFDTEHYMADENARKAKAERIRAAELAVIAAAKSWETLQHGALPPFRQAEIDLAKAVCALNIAERCVMAGNNLLQRMQSMTRMGMGDYVNDLYSKDLATVTGLLERAAGFVEQLYEASSPDGTTMYEAYQWLADYRAAKGE